MARRTDARTSVHIHTDIALGRHSGRSRMDAHPDAHGAGGKRQLCRARSGDRVGRTRKRDEERIALRVHFDAVVFGDRSPKGATMIGENVRVAIAELVKEPGRAFDVRE